MAKYIILTSWTAEGIKHVKESPSRLDKAREIGKRDGVTIESFYMVMGAHDMVVIVDAPDDAACARFTLRLSSGGAISTTTMKAFTEEEYRALVGGL